MKTLRHAIILFITFFLANVCLAQEYTYRRDALNEDQVNVFDRNGLVGYYVRDAFNKDEIKFYSARNNYYRQSPGFGQKDYTQLDRMRENLSLIIDRQLRNDAANLQAQREANEREKEENLLNETPIYDQQGKVQYTTHWNPLLQRYDVFNAKHALIGGYILNPQTNEWDFLTY